MKESRLLRDRIELLARRCEPLLFAPSSPYPLACFRVLFGCYLLWYFGRFISDVELLFSKNGVYSPFLMPDIAPPTCYAYALYLFNLACIVSFAFGYRTRLCTPIVTVLFLYYYFLNFAVLYTSFDRLSIITLGVLCFSDISAVWSVDSLLRGRRNFNPTVLAWNRNLLCLQLVFIYFGSGLWKLLNGCWHSGKILERSFSGIYATELGMYFVSFGWPAWFYDCLTFAVVLFELSLGFLLILKRTRRSAICLGIPFHLCNVFILYVPGFLNCVCMYVLFLEERSIRRTLSYLGGLKISRGLAGLFTARLYRTFLLS